MKNKTLLIMLTGACLGMSSCIDSFLDRKPLDVISDEVVWTNENAILANLALMYNQVQVEPHEWYIDQQHYMTDYTDESIRCYAFGFHYSPTFPDGVLNAWEYGKIRVIHEFMEHIQQVNISQALKDRYLAEAYFLRAFNYFVMAKRYGGVPLIKEVQKYDGTNFEDLKVARSTEEETWNFIAEDCDRAIAGLPETNVANERLRATKWAAYALKSRAMLYAGSISRYGSVQINGLVGIPAARADVYFDLSLKASEAIIASGRFKLYNQDADKADNFQKLFLERSLHEEAIYAKAYSTPDKAHSFDFYNAPTSFRIGYGNDIDPTLELVETFEYTDGRAGALAINDPSGNPVYYEHPEDIFAGKDPRFFATILHPNSPWQNSVVELRRGIINTAGEKVTSASYTTTLAEDPTYTISGKDGIVTSQSDCTVTGFLIKKFMDPANRVPSGQSQSWFFVFRYAETLLNYAEAAAELNRPADALPKLNEVRARAGISLKTAATLEDIRHERRVEFAFENQRYWDLVRWRIATTVMNNTNFSALLPWLDYKSRKYVFEKSANLLNRPKTFLDKNYYQPIPGINSNELLVQNPGY
jgi:hypothetical protein